jgi:hypothetical protein
MRLFGRTRRWARMSFMFRNDDAFEKMRARAEQIRRLAGMASDPSIALDLRCCATGLEEDIERLAASWPSPARAIRECNEMR